MSSDVQTCEQTHYDTETEMRIRFLLYSVHPAMNLDMGMGKEQVHPSTKIMGMHMVS